MSDQIKVWIVACQGLVGFDMSKYLEDRKVSYVGSSHKEVDVLNVKDLETFYQMHKPTHIINCSANVNVDKAENEEKVLARKVNVQGVINLAELAKLYDIKLVHIGTDYVFDGEKEGEYTETDCVCPINEYGRTKLEGERKMLEVYPKSVCVRTASLYGGGKFGLIHGIIKALQEKEIVQHISDQISSPTCTEDLAKALFDIRDQSGVFHFVNGSSVSRMGLVKEVKKMLEEKGIPIKCKQVVGVTRLESKRPAMRPKKTVLSTEKIKPFLTFPIRSWQSAVHEFVGEII